MGLFSKKTTNETFGALIDIGSGSVLVAIVHSKKSETHPIIVWSQREHAPLKNIDSLEQSAKAVITALMNATIQLDTVGRQALYEYNSSARIKTIQATISAPWSYTVTKTINFSQDEEFEVTEELFDELISATEEKIATELATNETVNNLGLKIITQATMDALSNGYRIARPQGSRAKEFSIARANVVAQEYLTDSIDETCKKVFSGAESKKLSFILMMYSVVRDLLPHIFEVCLVDITYEATEIGVVRDGSLQYCTHTPFGAFSLARELAAVLNTPLHEAFGYLHTENPFAFIESLSQKQKDEVEAIFDAYIEKLNDLFHETGDSLSIPKQIAIHCDIKSETFFMHMVEKAAKRSLKTSPITTLISSHILKQTYDPASGENFMKSHNDTALLLSALFFHMHHDSNSFEYV